MKTEQNDRDESDFWLDKKKIKNKYILFCFFASCSSGLMVVMLVMTRQVLLVIHRIVWVFQFNIARHVAVVVFIVADTVLTHHRLLRLLAVVVMTFAASTSAGRRCTTTATTPTAGSILTALLTIWRLIVRTVFAVLLDPFVLCPPILKPNFDLKEEEEEEWNRRWRDVLTKKRIWLNV